MTPLRATPPRALWLLPLLALGLGLPARAHLDVVFLLDTTGSMSGELSEARERVRQIASELRKARENERVRIGVVAYRDRGDEYVTKVSKLTTDEGASFAFLSGLGAGGGGDGPEDVVSGMVAALKEVGFDEGAETERQVFLIGDAPPHLDYADGADVDALLEEAVRRRIVFHAVGCRSLPREGVAFFQKVAYATEGSYQHIGHVQVGGSGGGLAGAVLDALAAPARREPGRPVAAREVPTRTQRTPRGIEVAHVSLREAPGGCGVEVALPVGVGLEGPPRFSRAEGALVVALSLSSGAGGARTFRLSECAPPTTPIRVTLGGAS